MICPNREKVESTTLFLDWLPDCRCSLHGPASVGHGAVKHAIPCVHKATRLPFYIHLRNFAVSMIVVELDHLLRGGEPKLRTKRIIIPRSVYVVRQSQGSVKAVTVT